MLQCFIVAVFQCYSVTKLQCYNFTLLKCYVVTMLQCYSVALLQYYKVTVLQYYSVTMLHFYNITILQHYNVTMTALGTRCIPFISNIHPHLSSSSLNCQFVPITACVHHTIIMFTCAIDSTDVSLHTDQFPL